VAVMVRRSHAEQDDIEAEMVNDDDTVELMISPETDEGPLLAVVEEEELTVHEQPVAVMDDDEATLADALEKKLEGGEGNARLERRMKRKQQREMQEMASVIAQGLPPLPAPQALPPLPAIDGQLPPPQLPLPDLKREVQCPSCNASFGVKDLMLKRTTCPVCQTKFDL
ncbi:MAG: hypothetical protein VW102_03345, partial [Poseidonia sp.]